MPRPRQLRLLLLLAAWGYSQWGPGALPAAAEGSAAAIPESVSGVLVLRNGNMLRGTVQREGDVYRVTMPQSELVVRVDQVDRFCQSVTEAYEQRRLERGSSADSHIDLARWCLRHDLLEFASRELLEARTLDAEHRQLLNLERQLQLALRNREAKARGVAVAAIAELPAEDHSKAIEGVPDWARTLFVRQIQPLLVESCAASGCHQPGGQEPFHLNRLALDGPGHPATTLSNLAATLEQLDLESPEGSALLLRAKTEHGGMNGTKPHELESHQYHMLRTWVEQLSAARRRRMDSEIELVAHHESPTEIEPALDRTCDPFDPAEFNARRMAADREGAAPAEPLDVTAADPETPSPAPEADANSLPESHPESE